jgi:hypothetical protein
MAGNLAAMKSRCSCLIRGVLASALTCALVTPALAQQPEAAPPADPAQPAEAPPTETPAPADTPAAPETPPAAQAPPAEGSKTVEDRLTDVEGKLDSMGEPFSAMQSDVAGLKRLKVSGYVQGRYEWHDDADFGQELRPSSIAGDSPTRVNRETSRFLVRRGRIKTTYVGDLSEFMLQIDATGDGVVVKDAEASLHITNDNPWMPGATPWELKLTLGQFKVPFGFEVLQSSGDRELPERTAVIRALFPGERDRGFRLQYSYDFLRLSAAVINGNFTQGDPHGANDQSSWKDVAGRLGADLDIVTFGLSGHVGRFLKMTRAPSMAMPVAGYDRYSRLRLGADAQLYFDVPALGGLVLRGEVIWARDKQLAFGGVEPAADRCKDADRLGWYATLVQNLGSVFAVAVRFDQYDPTSSLNDACSTMSTVTSADRDKQNNLGVALLAYLSGNLKLSLAYEHFAENEAVKKDNDALTVQLQAKF